MEDTPKNLVKLMKERFIRVGIFLKSLECFEKILKNTPENKTMKALYELLLGSQFETEKIDFILINSKNKQVLVKQVETVQNYGKLFKFGIPNPEYGSDHFPTKVVIEITKDDYSEDQLEEFEVLSASTNIPKWMEAREKFIPIMGLPQDFVKEVQSDRLMKQLAIF